MKGILKSLHGAGLGVALALGTLSVQPTIAQAQSVTAQTLVDRAEIQDLITRYYYNLGHGPIEALAGFYAEDAEFVLGTNTYKGRENIEGAYKALGASSPVRKFFSFNILVSNPLITVRGDTATAQLIYTEVVMDAPGATPRLLNQGREYDDLVRTNGKWQLKKRQVLPGAQSPAGWPQWEPRLRMR